MKRYGGLGDKVEQSIEKRHQLQVKMSIRLRSMKDVKTRLIKQYEYEWRSSHPRVKRIISEVEAPQRVRSQAPTLTLKQENTNKRIKLKAMERLETTQQIDEALTVLLCPYDSSSSMVIPVNISEIPNHDNENNDEICESTV